MFPNKDMPWGWENEVIQERSHDVMDVVDKTRLLSRLFCTKYYIFYKTSDITTISNDWGNTLQTSCKTLLKKTSIAVLLCSKFSVRDYSTSDIATGQTFAIN